MAAKYEPKRAKLAESILPKPGRQKVCFTKQITFEKCHWIRTCFTQTKHVPHGALVTHEFPYSFEYIALGEELQANCK